MSSSLRSDPTGLIGALQVNGTDCVTFDGVGLITGIEHPIKSIVASVSSNALTVGLAATTLEFRSSTLSIGATTRLAAPSQTMTIPAGATLGTVSGSPSRIVLLAINNAGTVELAVTNLAGGLNLDETTLVSTTALSAAATSASTVYSTTARTGVPFRVVGFVDSTQTTAGTWATAPSTVQGCGGQVIANGGKITMSTSQALAGSFVDFTVPTWAKRITVVLNGCSVSGTSGIKIQIGTASGAETSGYLGGSTRFAASAVSTSTETTGLAMDIGSDSAAAVKTGSATIQNLEGNTWNMAGSIQRSNAAGGGSSNASKTLSGALTRVRITSVNGTDTLTAGTANILCEGY